MLLRVEKNYIRWLKATQLLCKRKQHLVFARRKRVWQQTLFGLFNMVGRQIWHQKQVWQKVYYSARLLLESLWASLKVITITE